MKTGRNRWLNVVIWVFSITVIVVVGLLILSWRDLLKIEASELLRLLTFCVGGIGAAIGLKIAIERQDKFSEQVQVQIDQVQVQVDQSFNDRLGRGVELLKDEKKDEKNVVMRCAGLKVLEDLADNADGGQREIVLDIIYNFFHDNAKIKIEDGNKPRPRTQEKTTQDLQDALDILISLPINDREKLLSKRLVDGRLDFRKLDFRKLDFSHLDFSGKTLENLDFSEAVMDRTSFAGAIIKNVNFLWPKKNRDVDLSHAKIINSQFSSGDMVRSYFGSTTIENSTFFSMRIEDANFSNVEIINTKFESVEFIGGQFSSKKKMKVSSHDPFDPFDDLPRFFCTEFRNTKFDFADKTNLSYFFKSCYCPEDEDLPFLNEGKKYRYTIDRGNVFVDGSSWSGESVPKRVAVEIARRKLRNAERLLSIDLSTGFVENIKELKDKVEDIKKELRAAEKDLENDTNKHNPNPTGLTPKIPQ